MSDIKEGKNLENFKVVLMGESAVGKTSIINRYIKNIFEENILSSAGVGFYSKILNFPESKQSCKLDVIINLYNYNK